MIEKLSMEFTADMKRMEAVLDKVVLLIEAEHLPLRVVAILASHLAAASLKSIEDPQTRLRAFEAHAQVIACLLGIKTEMVVEV
jgi:hypothetical protein